MRRRDFITGFAGSAAARPFSARAQQTERLRRLGWLIAFPEKSPLARQIVTAVTQELQRRGWVERKNIHIDYRFAAGDPSHFRSNAADLLSLRPNIILASTTPVPDKLLVAADEVVE